MDRQAWLQARAGSLGASQIADALARTKTSWGASRANLIAQLVIERLTGVATEGYVSPAMQWGVDCESEARALYQFDRGVTIVETGLVKHPTIAWTHASPDGLVEDDGLVELKAPNTATHIDTLLGRKVPDRYWLQMQWQMACTGREWCDFVSYDPRVPMDLRLFILRVQRRDTEIKTLEKQVAEFVAEVDQKLSELEQLRQERIVRD